MTGAPPYSRTLISQSKTLEVINPTIRLTYPTPVPSTALLNGNLLARKAQWILERNFLGPRPDVVTLSNWPILRLHKNSLSILPPMGQRAQEEAVMLLQDYPHQETQARIAAIETLEN